MNSKGMYWIERDRDDVLSHPRPSIPKAAVKRHVLDRFELCDLLGLTISQYIRMQRHPDFPRTTRPDSVHWFANEAAIFKLKMARARRGGLSVPNIFFVAPPDP